MNKITKNTKCPNSKIKRSIFIVQYCISQRINQILNNLRTVLLCFYSFSNLQNFYTTNFLPSKIDIVSMYFLITILE